MCLCICLWKEKKTINKQKRANKGAVEYTRKTVEHIAVNHFLSANLEACLSSCGFVEGKVHVGNGDSTQESSHSGKQNATHKPTALFPTSCLDFCFRVLYRIFRISVFFVHLQTCIIISIQKSCQHSTLRSIFVRKPRVVMNGLTACY